MPIKSPDTLRTRTRYLYLLRRRENEAFIIPQTRQSHARWQQAAKRADAVARHIRRLDGVLSDVEFRATYRGCA